jgi:hypothetical protein
VNGPSAANYLRWAPHGNGKATFVFFSSAAETGFLQFKGKGPFKFGQNTPGKQ